MSAEEDRELRARSWMHVSEAWPALTFLPLLPSKPLPSPQASMSPMDAAQRWDQTKPSIRLNSQVDHHNQHLSGLPASV